MKILIGCLFFLFSSSANSAMKDFFSSIESVLIAGVERSYDVKVSNLEVVKDHNNLGLSRYQFLPTANLRSSVDSDDSFILQSLTVNLNVFDRLSMSYDYQQAKVQTKIAEYEKIKKEYYKI